MSGDFRVGDWIVRPLRRTIDRADRSVHITPKAMAVFECLAAARGETVSREALFDAAWPGAEVSEDVLAHCITELRKAFGDSAHEPRVIETIPKLGFRLLLPVEPLEEEPPTGAPSSAGDQLLLRGRWRRSRPAGLLLAGVVLVVGLSLSITGIRLWLTEAGTTLVLKTAAFISDYRLEQKPGIAVLPLVNFSDDPDNEYFSDGMSVEIINRLARANRLPVIAQSSSFLFKGRSPDIREIGRLLGVTHVLEGSVRKADGTVRMTVQLIDTVSGAHVWSEVYQRELSDIFDLQNEIAKSVVDQISLALGDEIAPPPVGLPAVEFMRTRPTSNLAAYDWFLKGVQMVTSNRPALMEQAPGYFDKAIALDRDYADAWAGKGFALSILGWSGSGSTRIPASVYPDAIAAFRRALEIEPGHAFATGWLGATLIQNDFKWAEGMRLLEQSLAQNPNDAAMLAAYGHYLGVMKIEGAGEVVERAYRLDPFGIQPVTALAAHLVREGRLLDAASLMEASMIIDREGYTPHLFTAFYNLRLGRLDLAEERLRKARLVANPVDLTLDALESVIDSRRGRAPRPPFAETWERMQTEHLHGAVLWDGWTDEQQIVAVFDLAIEQRHPELRAVLFGPKPPLMPEADWRRFKEITGVTQFQDSLNQ